MPQKTSLFKAAASMGALTMVSRVLGFVRDVIMANQIGAGMVSDAFFVAFKLPNFMRRLFAEGAFNAAFVPIYSSKLAAEGREEARLFAQRILSVMAWFMLGFTVLAIFAMPWITYILAPGFHDDVEKFALTVDLSRITFPYLMCMALTVLFTGMVNSDGRFAAGAAAPILLNLCLIGGMLWLPDYVGGYGHAMAWSVFLAGIVQMLWMYWFVVRAKLTIFPGLPRYNAEVAQLLKLAGPAAFGASVVQINLMVDLMMASSIPSGVTYLYYADRVNELPLAVIGIAIGTALLPMLSKQFRLGEIAEAHETQNRALELAMLFSIPATVALLPLAYPIVMVLFQHGAFTPEDAWQTALTLAAYAIGLPAFICIKLYVPGFYANHDTKTPVQIAIRCLIIHASLNLVLIQLIGQIGLALSSSIAAWLNIYLMHKTLAERSLIAPDARLKQRLKAQLLAALLMLILLSPLSWWLWNLLPEQPTHWHEAGILTLLVSFGMTSYFTAAHRLGAYRITDIRKAMRRSGKTSTQNPS